MNTLCRVLLAVSSVGLVVWSCSEDSPSEPPAKAPMVSGVSATIVSPGDTLTITGADFASPAGANQVTFTNSLGVSTPFAGNTTTLQVVVDQDATTGQVTVTSEGGTGKGPSVDVRRGIGDFFVFGLLGAENVLSLPNPTAATRYLVIPHATNPGLQYNQDVAFQIQTEAVVPVAAPGAQPAAPATNAAVMGVGETFEAWRWEQARELAESVGDVSGLSAPAVRAPAAVQQERQFYVLNTTTGSLTSPSSYDRVTAQLRYPGSKCLVYADVDTFAAGNNFSDAQLATIGQAFDNTIEATNVQYFGGYSDVDGNGKVIILVTPVVNRLTPSGSGGFIAGFFLSIDLLAPPTVPAGTTNHAEIFYLLAADPLGQTGNAFPIDFALAENISTTAHEHEHMISFSHRLFQQGGVTQVTWLEEGMAHMAEDLNALNDSNIDRANIYLGAPSSTSLEHNTAPLPQRGGIYLFLRLMADRYGTGILKEIVQSKCTGRDCIRSVTGEQFYDLVAEFLAALYLSGRGLTPDPRFNYTSIDLADFTSVGVSTRTVGGSDVAGNVRKATGALYVFNGAGTQSNFTFIEPFGIGRLRNVVVRIQ